MRRRRAVVLCAGALLAAAGVARAGSPRATPLVLAGTEAPRIEFAQRALRRPVVVDTTVVESARTEARKSRGLAVALGALAPGTGQLYLGQRHGYVQLGVEVLGWFSFASLHASANDKRDQYAAFVGDATSPLIADANHWQFDRYCPTTADCDTTDYNDLLRQWQDDRTRFYESITDPRYSRGWSDTTSAAHYETLRDQSNRVLRLSRYATAVIIVNHVVSLIDVIHSTRHAAVSEATPRRVSVDWALAPSGDGHAAVVVRF